MWNDPEVGIKWPIDDIENLIFSEKDQKWPKLSECGIKF
ncbi:dTDP-4-dehydrorhamnose 3,5-epimerase-like enzyme [Clostridium acetobutylicum]|nr:dTDP-4-dehydrorhamnose 3,5-epimerase-like enzyme [Clostridium acetobutylicum]